MIRDKKNNSKQIRNAFKILDKWVPEAEKAERELGRVLKVSK